MTGRSELRYDDRAMRRIFNLTLVLLVLSLLAVSPSTVACDTDADCDLGGTCIKREKRARGVCYGETRGATEPELRPAPSSGGHITDDRRERMIEFMGDPEQLLKQHLPGREVGEKCLVSQDCPANFDCVYAGFEGRCVKF
ncbi:MAG: hypothetical protein O7B81_04235 [Gammaproteobacteria bacterium]|nr:hypothetical protein [Gammaproteobacteria bacterium]